MLCLGERFLSFLLGGPCEYLEPCEERRSELLKLRDERVCRLELVLVDCLFELDDLDFVVLHGRIVDHVVVVEVHSNCRLH